MYEVRVRVRLDDARDAEVFAQDVIHAMNEERSWDLDAVQVFKDVEVDPKLVFEERLP